MRNVRMSALAIALCVWVSAAIVPLANAQLGAMPDPEYDFAVKKKKKKKAKARCHCPCALTCGEGVVCDCAAGSEDCKECACASKPIELEALQALAEEPDPTLALSFASWLDTEPFDGIEAGVTLEMADTGREESFLLRWVQAPDSPWRYVPDASFDRDALAAWVARVQPGASGRLYAAVRADPGTYRIADGDLNHLNHSMEKTVSFVLSSGRDLPLFRSDSTLGWEMTTYLQQTVAGLDPSAFAEDPSEVRAKMLGRLDAIDLQIKGGDHEAALATLVDLISKAEETWLVKGNRHAISAICAFGKLRALLDPGSASCSTAVAIE